MIFDINKWFLLNRSHCLVTAIVYFVLWAEQILNHLLYSNEPLSKKARRYVTKLELPQGLASTVDRSTKLNKPYDKEWLKKAQDEMMKVQTRNLEAKLVGLLYKLCVEHSETDDHHSHSNPVTKNQTKGKKKRQEFKGVYDIYNEDSIAFARAYKDAMVRSLLFAFNYQANRT